MAWCRFHPLSRITIAVATVLILASFTGWQRVGDALAEFSPGGSFESRCGGLPMNEVAVALAPLALTEDRDTPFAALTKISEGPSPAHRTIGLTRANFGHRSTIEFKGLDDRNRGRACVRPRVNVELFIRPLTVYVAREYSGDPCRSRVIREHEQRHVDVYAAYASEAAQRLAGELDAAIGNAPHFGDTIADAQRRVDRRIADALTSFLRDTERVLAARQGAVDTPEEYERVRTACDAG
jgi:hypothetical protein